MGKKDKESIETLATESSELIVFENSRALAFVPLLPILALSLLGLLLISVVPLAGLAFLGLLVLRIVFDEGNLIRMTQHRASFLSVGQRGISGSFNRGSEVQEIPWSELSSIRIREQKGGLLQSPWKRVEFTLRNGSELVVDDRCFGSRIEDSIRRIKSVAKEVNGLDYVRSLESEE